MLKGVIHENNNVTLEQNNSLQRIERYENNE